MPCPELQLSGEQQGQLARTMLQLLAGSDDPDSTEKALLGLRSLLVAGGQAVRSTLMEDGAESVLREVCGGHAALPVCITVVATSTC